MTVEILYCARCRRVIRPREIAEGKYHFADGEPVCAECFTRLSRRLRPISGIHEPPKPVDLSGIVDKSGAGAEEAEAKPKDVAAAEAAPPPPTRAPSGRRIAGPGAGTRFLVVAAFAIAGLLAGCGVYLATRRAAFPGKGSDARGAAPAAAFGGGSVEHPADKPPADPSSRPGSPPTGGAGETQTGNPSGAAK